MMNPEIKLIEVPCPVCGIDSDEIAASGYDFEYHTSRQKFFFHKCKRCGLIYLSPRPETTELSKIYPLRYNPFRFHQIKNPIVRWGRNFIQTRKVSTITKLLSRSGNIIDVGCGSGTLLMLLKKYGRKDWHLFGNDFNVETLKPLRNFEIEAIPGRFEEISTDVCFDLIILNQSIEHLDNPIIIIKKASELLKPKGILFIETPCTEGLDAIFFRRRYWGGYHIPRHWTLFSSRSISKLLKDEGFDQIKVTYLASPSFWIQSFHHYFLDKCYPTWWINFWVFKNPLLLILFTAFDILNSFWRPTSNMRVVARKKYNNILLVE